MICSRSLHEIQVNYMGRSGGGGGGVGGQGGWMGLSGLLSYKYGSHWQVSKCQGEIVDTNLKRTRTSHENSTLGILLIVML